MLSLNHDHRQLAILSLQKSFQELYKSSSVLLSWFTYATFPNLVHATLAHPYDYARGRSIVQFRLYKDGRLPPTRIEENLNALLDICPEYADDLLGSVDQPLKLLTDHATGRDYLACDYNRDGDSYRSPWSNEYDPPLEDGTVPSTKLRRLEVAANDAFDTYREMYYEGGVSSVFLWDQDDGGFAGVVLFKKLVTADDTNATEEGEDDSTGSWQSIHVFEASEKGRSAHYKLTSTIMLEMITKGPTVGDVNLSGSLTRQNESDYPISEPGSHIANMGRMIEDMEIKMRNLLQEVYFGKTRDIVFDLRSVEGLERAKQQRALQKELVGLIKR